MNRKRNYLKMSLAEICITCLIGMIGIFEIGHLAGVFGGCTLSDCGRIVAILLGISLCLVIVIGRRCVKKIKTSGKPCFPGLLFFVMLFLQIYGICSSSVMQAAGDITLETVNSFLVTDRVYEVSPLTGKVFGGAPLRYEILCLPTIYTLVCKWTGLEPVIVIGKIIPVVVVCLMYMNYGLLGDVLFKNESENKKKKWWFLVMTAAVIFLCEGSVFMDGYGILHAGHMGTTIRNSVLIPLTVYAALDRKYYLALLCILAELCIVWTFWGMGMCLLVFVGLLSVKWLEERKCLCRVFPILKREGEAE